MPDDTAPVVPAAVRPEDSLIQALPELIAFVRRDGTVVRELGGRRLGLPGAGALVGRRIQSLWPAAIADPLLLLIRKALRDRGSAGQVFVFGDRRLEARVAAQGVDRVLFILREALTHDEGLTQEDVRASGDAAIQRRALFERLLQSVADAVLHDRGLAIVTLHLEGLGELGRILDFALVEAVAAAQLQRIVTWFDEAPAGAYAGRLEEDTFLIVLDHTADRGWVRQKVTELLGRLGEPVELNHSQFSVVPSAGVAVLGEDARAPRELLECARAAMADARRAGVSQLRFFSDTLQLRSLARLDSAQELREALDQDRLDLRYVGRYALDGRRLVAVHAYLRWRHPVRGHVAAAEFLPIAESTGLATRLSTWALNRFRRDIPGLRTLGGPGMRFSFGALRAHLSSTHLMADVAALLEGGVLTAEELELRVSEKMLVGMARPGANLRSLANLGVGIIVDEFGRGVSSIPRLARLPLQGLQLDRRIALAAAADAVAARTAAAAFALAKALLLTPIAAGVDDAATLQRLQSLGCVEGLGDAFGSRFAAPEPAAAHERQMSR